MPKARRRAKKSAQARGGGFLNLRSRKVVRVARTSLPSSRLPSSKAVKASKGSGGTSRPEVSTAFCVVCGDGENAMHGGWIKAPCAHTYCLQCAEILVTTYVRDESLHPIRCCNKTIPKSDVDNLLSKMGDPARHSLFQDKYEEYSTPAQERTYCPSQNCNKFLSQNSTRGPYFTCPSCSSEVCKQCKRLAHPRESCDADDQAALFQKLAKRKKWQACTKCGRMIEKDGGCLHINCKCGHYFCYKCGGSLTSSENHLCRS